MKLIVLATFLFSGLSLAQEVGPYAPTAVNLSFTTNNLTFPDGRVKLKNSYDLLKTEYQFSVNFAQINDKKISINTSLLEEIEFLSQFKDISRHNIEYRDREVVAYLKYRGIDTSRIELDNINPKIDNLKTIIHLTEERLQDLNSLVSSKEKKETLNLSIEDSLAACKMNSDTIYSEHNGNIGLNYSYSKHILCLMTKFKLEDGVAEQMAIRNQKHFIENDLAPKLSKHLQTLSEQKNKLSPDVNSIDIKKANQLFLSRYEILPHLATKVFKVIDTNVAINDDSIIKDVPTSVVRSPAINQAKSE